MKHFNPCVSCLATLFAKLRSTSVLPSSECFNRLFTEFFHPQFKKILIKYVKIVENITWKLTVFKGLQNWTAIGWWSILQVQSFYRQTNKPIKLIMIFSIYFYKYILLTVFGKMSKSLLFFLLSFRSVETEHHQ